MAKKPLISEKQMQFCREYLIDLNGTQAAIRSGYSKKTANVQASDLLTKPNIQAYLSELQAKRSAHTYVTAERVLQELAKIAFCNPQDYLKSNHTIEDLKKLDRDKAAAIKSITVFGKGGGNIEIKFHDKKAALELIGKHIGFFKEDNLQVNNKLEIKITRDP